MAAHEKSATNRSEVRGALLACSPWFAGVAFFSALVNILYLTGSLYMLQVYDRVLASRSVPTLLALSFVALIAFLLQGQLDSLRARMLTRIGARFDELLATRMFQIISELPLKGNRDAKNVTPLRDMDYVRGFMSGLGPTAFFDMPFSPLFLFVTFLLHPWLGWFTLGGAVCIMALTLLTEVRSRSPAKAMVEDAGRRQTIVDVSRRNAEALMALGMRDTFRHRFLRYNRQYSGSTIGASDVSNRMNSAAKTFRMVLQSGSLGLGAYLAIEGQISAGVIIAASILTSRTLAPIETAVAHWKHFVAARLGYSRLQKAFDMVLPPSEHLVLPKARRSLVINNVRLTPPGGTRPVLDDIDIELQAGDGLGLVGATGSGKSSLARAIVGVWPAAKGDIRLDGATLEQWGTQLGSQVGYLPQDVELFEGTIAQNIARFTVDAKDSHIVEAAQQAEAHEMILQLPNGYNTQIGEFGASLSGGQRQRIALARALFGEPFLLVLDEPNANLDSQGDQALAAAIMSLRQRGGIAVIITHRPSGLAAVNKVAVIRQGRVAIQGPRDQVMQALDGSAQNNAIARSAPAKEIAK